MSTGSWFDKPAIVRAGIDATASATSLGFTAAKLSTKLGVRPPAFTRNRRQHSSLHAQFTVTRGLTTTGARLAGAAVDHALFSGRLGAGARLAAGLDAALALAERAALAPLDLGETFVSSSLVATRATLDILYPGSEQPSAALPAFAALVRRELRAPPLAHTLPEGWETMRTTELAAGIAAWAAVQRATTRWKEAQWLAACTELPVGPGAEDAGELPPREQKRSTVRVRADAVHAPGDGGQVVSADIDPAPSLSTSTLSPAPALAPLRPATATRTRTRPLSQPSIAETKATLRRLSALVLAGYGGASLWALGAPLVPRTPHGHAAQQAQIAAAVQRSEEEEAGGPPPPSPAAAAALSGVGDGGAAAQVEAGAGTSAARSRYAWHALLRGTHDAEIFAAFAGSTPSAAAPDPDEPAARAAGAHLGAHADMPRFWVLADGARREVVLVVRGTMSGAELAADVACAPVPFAPARTPRPSERGDAAGMPGYLPTEPPRVEKRAEGGEGEAGEPYMVHGGMLLLAQAMGGRGKPVHVAVAKALRAHRGYGARPARSMDIELTVCVRICRPSPLRALTRRGRRDPARTGAPHHHASAALLIARRAGRTPRPA
jgi:sn1-specific diacylglycerol lipase